MATQTQNIPQDRFIDAVKSADHPAVTAADVAAEIGCGSDAAAARLDQLAASGPLAAKSVNGEHVWYIAGTA